jgi:hypothetical protein
VTAGDPLCGGRSSLFGSHGRQASNDRTGEEAEGAYFVFLGGLTMAYLVLVELVKRRLMRKLLGLGPATPVAKSVTPAS